MQITSTILTLAGDGAKLLAHAETPWHSATFSGARHALTLSFEGESAITMGEAFLAELPDHEFDFRGQLVAEAKIVWRHYASAPLPRLDAQIELLMLDVAKEKAA